MNLDVYRAAEWENGGSSVDCEACEPTPGVDLWAGWQPGDCLQRPSVCNSQGVIAFRLSPSGGVGGFESVSVLVAEGQTIWALVVEFWLGQDESRGRVCLVPTTDFLNDCDSPGPICAVSGVIEYRDDGGDLHGRVRADFGPYRASWTDGPNQMGGLRVSARF